MDYDLANNLIDRSILYFYTKTLPYAVRVVYKVQV